MRIKHLMKRGSRYMYRCRVPVDLLPLFPSPVIWKSLHTDDHKDATVAASVVQYNTQKLFMQLRTGMLSPSLMKIIIAEYIKTGVDALQDKVHGKQVMPTKSRVPGVGKAFGLAESAKHEMTGLVETVGESQGMSSSEIRADFDSRMGREINRFRGYLADGRKGLPDPLFMPVNVDKLADNVQKQQGVRVTEADRKEIGLKLINAKVQLLEAERATLRGDWSTLDLLTEKVQRDLAVPFVPFEEALEKYAEWYRASKPNLKAGTMTDMEVECRVLLEIIGNIGIAEVNMMETLTKLKRILRRFPLNKVQRYGNKSIHTIMKTEEKYDTISLKTANEYLKRLKAVITHAGKEKWITGTNVVEGELFKIKKQPEQERLPYDRNDIERLIDAMCTKPLWKRKGPKPERFWIILIALFHGFRLGNIVGLKKSNIKLLDGKLWVFDLREGKSDATIRPVAICDELLLLGFLEWVESLDRVKLFKDSSSSFSQWYNRDDHSPGFEPTYVTTEDKKCLYSLRHTFAGSVFEVTSDFKITADMMGHSTGSSVTARYTKHTKAAKLKEVSERMNLEGVDLNRLEVRVKELFPCMKE